MKWAYLHRLIFVGLCFCSCIVSAQNSDLYEHVFDSLKKNNQLDKLIPYFQKELKAHPKNENLLRWLGYSNVINDKPDEGQKYYSQALIVNPACAACYLWLCRIAAMKKDTGKAIELLNKAILTNPKDASFYAVRSSLTETVNAGPALEDLKKAISLDPKQSGYYVQRGDYRLRQQSLLLAMADYDQAIRLDEHNYDAYLKRANVYYEQRKWENCLSDLDKAYAIDSTRGDLYFSRAAVNYVLKNFEQSIDDYTKAIRFNPNDYMAYYYRANTRYSLEDMDGACTDNQLSYSILKKTDPSNALVKELEQSLNDYCDTSNEKYYYQRGIAFYNLGKFKEAVEVYSYGLQKFPTSGMMINFRGNAYLKLKEYNRAIKDYSESIGKKDYFIRDMKRNYRNSSDAPDVFDAKVNTYMANTLQSMAEAEFALGLHGEALKDVNTAIATQHTSAEATTENFYNLRGDINAALGKFEQAIKDYDTCLQLNSNSAWPYINRAVAKLYTGVPIRIQSYFITLNTKNQQSNTNWSLPINSAVRRNNSNIISALGDCNKGIALDANIGYAYYVRAEIKKMLGDNPCFDFLKAKELGYPLPPESMKNCGR